MSTALRTLCTLTPGEKSDGTKCLRGTLARTIVTTDPAGNQRTYPAGTKLMLKRNPRGDYSLLAIVENVQSAP